MHLGPVIDYELPVDQIWSPSPLTLGRSYLTLALVIAVSLLLVFVNNFTTLSDFIDNIFSLLPEFASCNAVSRSLLIPL